MLQTPITAWANKSGNFQRQQSQFRNAISRQRGARHPPQANRYHLYVSYACPWAHRVLIVRHLKGLQEILPYSTVHWEMLEKGWRFFTTQERKGETSTLIPDATNRESTHLRDIYLKEQPDYAGRFTVPLLYDMQEQKIVSNEVGCPGERYS